MGPWRRARSPEHGRDLGFSCLSSSWLPVGTKGPGLRMPCRQHSGSSDASLRSLGSACACGLRAGGRCSATARARAPPPISRSSTGATTCRSRRARLWPCSRRPSPHGSRCAHQQAPRAYSWLSAGLRARFPAVACVHVYRYRELLSAALQDGEGHMFFCEETADLAGCDVTWAPVLNAVSQRPRWRAGALHGKSDAGAAVRPKPDSPHKRNLPRQLVLAGGAFCRNPHSGVLKPVGSVCAPPRHHPGPAGRPGLW